MDNEETKLITVDDPKDEITHVIGGIYLSSYIGAKAFEGPTLNVHHDCTLNTGFQIPLLNVPPNSFNDRTGAKVNPKNLELLHVVLQATFDSNGTLLIHCKGGKERSPLTVATWLVKSGNYATLDEAYEFLKSKRSVVEDRRDWLADKLGVEY